MVMIRLTNWVYSKHVLQAKFQSSVISEYMRMWMFFLDKSYYCPTCKGLKAIFWLLRCSPRNTFGWDVLSDFYGETNFRYSLVYHSNHTSFKTLTKIYLQTTIGNTKMYKERLFRFFLLCCKNLHLNTSVRCNLKPFAK